MTEQARKGGLGHVGAPRVLQSQSVSVRSPGRLDGVFLSLGLSMLMAASSGAVYTSFALERMRLHGRD